MFSGEFKTFVVKLLSHNFFVLRNAWVLWHTSSYPFVWKSKTSPDGLCVVCTSTWISTNLEFSAFWFAHGQEHTFDAFVDIDSDGVTFGPRQPYCSLCHKIPSQNLLIFLINIHLTLTTSSHGQFDSGYNIFVSYRRADISWIIYFVTFLLKSFSKQWTN